MSLTALNLPTKPCHNCRRRRWRCDRSLPVCQKCRTAGSECLGYGKLFVWNRGVASRGKMMGKGYEDQMTPGCDGIDEEAKTQTVPCLIWEQEQATQQQQHHHRHYQLESSRQNASPEPGHASPEPGHAAPEPEHVALTNHHDPMALTVQRPLVDPLVNDLDQNSRYYLYHFATQLCEVLVVYDMPGQNPIRDLIPATSAYPLLLHIIIANSAFHIFNILQNPIGQSAYQAEQSPRLVAYHQDVGRFGGSLRSSYRDALVAKQQALSLLAQSVATVNSSNIDLILITILMFVNYALVESGRDKWKVHMDGAQKLIMLLGQPPYLQRPMSRLRLTILSDFLVFYILGSTFCFSSTPHLLPETLELDPILRYAETNNYLSCPGPLLRIMIESFGVPDTRKSPFDDMDSNAQEQLSILLRRTLDFDPIAWSCDFERASPLEDIQQRIRIASAHRSAVCIYLARVLPCTNPLFDPASGTALVSLTALSNDVIFHISHLKPGDVLFKSICWPLFLAGAESDDPVQREWIMDTLDQLYSIMYWGYIHTVKRVLEAVWRWKDKAGVGGNNIWIEEVNEFGSDLLIA